MSEMTLKEFAHKHNEIIDRMKRVLKFLTKSSNVNKEEVDHIQETFEALKAKAENEGKPATKTMGDLTLEQVQAIFQLTKLTPDNDEAGDMWECNAIKAEDLHCPEDFHEFYAFLLKALDYLDTANNGSTKAEAQVRARLDVILGLVLGFAKKEGRVVTKRMVSWGYETQFWATVRMGPEMVKLSGRPDYALWYGAQASLETNLLVVEAERTERLGWGERQLLAYMGLVHSGRIEREKEDTTVYGITTDSITFNFYRINEKSKWCSRSFTWGYTHDQNREIIGILLKIFGETSIQSPRESRSRRQFSSSAGDDEPMVDVPMKDS